MAILVRASIGAIVVGVLGLTLSLLFVPLAGSLQGQPVPIAQPITPGGFPYSSLAVLRKQRMSNDVLPPTALANENGTLPRIVAASARLLARDGTDEYFIAVDAKNQVCLLYVSTVSAGYNSGCSNGTPDGPGAGMGMGGVGSGSHFSFAVVADGTPVPGAVPAGYRKILPNVWMNTHGF
jgi:hypothetical protein